MGSLFGLLLCVLIGCLAGLVSCDASLFGAVVGFAWVL